MVIIIIILAITVVFVLQRNCSMFGCRPESKAWFNLRIECGIQEQPAASLSVPLTLLHLDRQGKFKSFL